jgi:Xaa-Pro dipeptidase
MIPLMTPTTKINDLQRTLRQQQLDGWLLYDFRRNNELACAFLEIPPESLLTRRFFYWIPAEGTPIKIVSAIEPDHLNHLPGNKQLFRTWQELESQIETLLRGKKRIAMEYSPRNANPYVSKVDAGTADLVRCCGVELVSSADLLQPFTSLWTPAQLASHYAAAKVLDETDAKAWRFISEKLRSQQPVTEYDVQQFILQQFAANNCHSEGAPICAVNAHAADPHYTPAAENSSTIAPGDFVLIDLWCKQKIPQAVYADITRVAVAAAAPTELQSTIFTIVREAQEAGTALVQERYSQQKPLMGWEVDQACRQHIASKGYGEFFIHRTGHNIGIRDHGDGAHLDNYETQDHRQLIAGTCFSVEPGIYLPGNFGVRLEYNIYLHPSGQIEITGGIQNHIVTLF